MGFGSWDVGGCWGTALFARWVSEAREMGFIVTFFFFFWWRSWSSTYLLKPLMANYAVSGLRLAVISVF